MPRLSFTRTSARGAEKWLSLSLQRFVLVVVVVVLLMTCSVTMVSSNDSKEDWYKRYPYYHPYCSTPQEMATRAIPPVQDNDARVGESRLLQATVVIRHGARTPWTSNLQYCWDGYHTNPETAVWDCNLTTYLAPPPPALIDLEAYYGDSITKANVNVNVDEGNSMFLFEKKYTALHEQPAAANLSNALLGTCQLGQLLMQGYEQQIVNGQHLRNAYFYDGSVVKSHDERMRLIDVSSTSTAAARGEEIWRPSNLYYRSDDDQRTLMSGQVLLRGLFGPEIRNYYQAHNNHANNNDHGQIPFPVVPVHTADRSQDIMDPNEYICPRLAEMHERLVRSKDYQSFIHSPEAHTLRRFVKDILRAPSPIPAFLLDGPEPEEAILLLDIMDCLMTTMCTDRPLHEALNDYTPGPPTPPPSENRKRQRKLDDAPSTASATTSKEYQNMFQRLYDYHVARTALLFRANNAEYAKLAMAPLWVEILPHLLAAMEESPRATPSSTTDVVTPAKLALFSGHDTTIMPLLVSLGPNVWDGQWTPYASSLIIEIHAVHIDGRTDNKLYTTDHAFRLIYNGKVYTHHVPGCPESAELCDAIILLNIIQSSIVLDKDNDQWMYAKQCQRQFPPLVQYMDSIQKVQEILATPGGFLAVLGVAVLSGILGAVSTLVLLRTRTGRSILARLCTYCCCCFGIDNSHNSSSYKDEDSEHGIALTSSRNDNGTYSDDPPSSSSNASTRENGDDNEEELGIS